MNSKSLSGVVFILFLLLGGMIVITPGSTDRFAAIPGEMLDARLNNVLLEHLYHWVQGSCRIWDPQFFYPYEHVLAFSDNHFGSGGLYIIGRWIGLNKEQAFNLWFLVAYPLNFISCCYVLRKFGFSTTAAAIGAFIFTFSLPVLGQTNHAQLGYRFAIPMAILCLDKMLSRIGWAFYSFLGYYCFWLSWQFACSIYLGFFLSIVSVTWIVSHGIMGWRPIQNQFQLSDWPQSRSPLVGLILGGFGIVALICLLVPYAYVSREYHFVREDWEITSMVPRLGSYLIADNSWLSGGLGKMVTNIPMRHEHQLFIGFIPILLLCSAVLIYLLKKDYLFSKLAGVSILTLLILLILTTVIHRSSIYFILIHLPLVNALRSVSRIELAELFPVAVLCSVGFDAIYQKLHQSGLRWLFLAGVSFALILEVSNFAFSTVSISGSKMRIESLKHLLPSRLPAESILFLEKDPVEGDFIAEVDGMILGQELGLPTWNGYSGNTPPGHGDGRNFSDAIRQMAVYCLFRGASEQAYRKLIDRIVPLRCNDNVTIAIPHLPELVQKQTISDHDCALVDIRLNSMEFLPGNLLRIGGVLHNGSSQPLRSVSVLAHPIRFTWRWVAVERHEDNSGYSPRSDLKWDLPAGEKQDFFLDLKLPTTPGVYRPEVTLIEEGTRFFHLEGMSIPVPPNWIEVHSDGSSRLIPPSKKIEGV